MGFEPVISWTRDRRHNCRKEGGIAPAVRSKHRTGIKSFVMSKHRIKPARKSKHRIRMKNEIRPVMMSKHRTGVRSFVMSKHRNVIRSFMLSDRIEITCIIMSKRIKPIRKSTHRTVLLDQNDRDV